MLNWREHQKNPVTLLKLKGLEFSFCKPEARIYHLDPVRVFLVENIESKWLFWGHALIQKQEIRKLNPGPNWKAGDWETAGVFLIESIYDPDYQKLVSLNESPPGKCFGFELP